MIERDLTDADGIITVTSTNRWTEAELNAHFDALRAIIAQKRQAGEQIRVLSDVTGAGEQDAGTGALILAQFRRTYRPEDRVAMLTANENVKMVVRAMLQDFNIAAFSSRLPAEMWLMADGLPPPR
ncbi:hypothetical protein [Sphingobium sp.]|uniref:hypothetical protein n=1 Tax=Sphingobium sp. TaxID=1912891 RepID=UPI003BB758BA